MREFVFPQICKILQLSEDAWAYSFCCSFLLLSLAVQFVPPAFPMWQISRCYLFHFLCRRKDASLASVLVIAENQGMGASCTSRGKSINSQHQY